MICMYNSLIPEKYGFFGGEEFGDVRDFKESERTPTFLNSLKGIGLGSDSK